MAVHEIGDWVTPRLMVAPFDATTAATLLLTRPDGTTDSPAVTGSGAGETWTATAYEITQPGQWAEQWTITGTGKGRESRIVYVFPFPPFPLGKLSDPYVWLDALKDRLGITDRDDDFKLTQAIAATSYGIEQFCGRQFNRDLVASARVFHSLRNGRLVRVDDFWESSSAVLSTDDDDDGTYETAWAAADYELRPLNGVVAGRPGWPYTRVAAAGVLGFPTRHRAGVRLLAKWGWLSVPYPVTESAFIVSEEIFKLKDAPFGVAGFGEFGAMRVRMNSAAVTMLTPFVKDPIKVA